MSDLVKPSMTEAAMRKAAMSLPPSDFGSHRAIQAAARAADDLIAPYRVRIAALEAERDAWKDEHAVLRDALVERDARIAALEGDADMVDEREMRSNLRIEALEAMLQKVVTQERRVAASTDMTRSAMREGAAELVNQIDAALKGDRDE